MQPVVVSIHDVMPTTLEQVEAIINVARGCGIQKITLLIVPGHAWQSRDVDRLRAWCDTGYQIAGHGWLHHCQTIRTWTHRLHSLLLSRNAAEHLSVSADQCRQIVVRCAEWFQQRQLPEPLLYVPPAWALGQLAPRTLRSLPFQMFESYTGVIDTKMGVTYRLPLIGFEADSLFRLAALRCWNGLNATASACLRRPLRLAIHPHDLQLRLSRDVYWLLLRTHEPIDYGDLRPKVAARNISRCL